MIFREFNGDTVFKRNVPTRTIETDGGDDDIRPSDVAVRRGQALGGSLIRKIMTMRARTRVAGEFSGVEARDGHQVRPRMGYHRRKTEGKCMVIIGAGVSHWYHNNLIYRSAMCN
ncbi:MAG: hypothetical protein R2682_13635 [Pyrinomonadaceae bacterium]